MVKGIAEKMEMQMDKEMAQQEDEMSDLNVKTPPQFDPSLPSSSCLNRNHTLNQVEFDAALMAGLA